ncbi:hypothetical protein VN1289_08850 [Helicobacter pylori]|nr:hypothetical protein VN1289_08850 [Helicobacter pylori]
MIALRNARKLDLISVNPNQSLLAQLKMLKRLVAVIFGCRTYNDGAIIKEFGSKEANPLKPINLTLTLGIVSLTNKTF